MKGCRIPRNGRLRKKETGASRVRGLPAGDVCGNRTMGQTIAHLTVSGGPSVARRPIGIGAAKGRRRTMVRVETQDHQCRSAPSGPVRETGGGYAITPQPGHRGAREGSAIIARTRDHRNRHRLRDAAPVTPAVELGQIVRPHQPHEFAFGIAAHQPSQGIDSIARPQLPLDRGGADRCAARLSRRLVRCGPRSRTPASAGGRSPEGTPAPAP